MVLPYLTCTSMIPVILFQSDDQYGVLPAAEIAEGEVILLIEYDPYSGARPVH